MTTYADPTRCPDCRAALPPNPTACRLCSLPLTGDTVVSLFSTLQEADRLLGVLRAEKRAAVPVSVAAAVPAGAPIASGGLLDGAERYPAPRNRTDARDAGPRVRGSSVPKILLSLGALCLLVAAVIFLAVAWSWLGVGGRTTVLIALTGLALGSAVSMHRRGLRMAAEALCVVGLGLLAMDVFGVDAAGWLGTTGAGTAAMPGAVVAAGALLMLLLTWERPLVAPGVIAPVASLAAGVGSVWDAESAFGLLVTCLPLLALGRVGTTIRMRSMVAASLGATAVALLAVLVDGFDTATAGPQTVQHLWYDAAARPLVAATLVLAAAGPAVGLKRVATSVCFGLSGLLGSYVAVLAALDNGLSAALTPLVVLAGGWAFAMAVAPARHRLALMVPMAGTVVVPLYAVCVLLISSFSAVATVGDPFTRAYDVHVATVYTEPSRWLLAPSMVVVALAACSVLAWVGPLATRAWVAAMSSALALGVLATVPLFDVPLAVVAGAFLGLGLVALVAAERLPGATALIVRLGALGLSGAAVAAALPSDRLTTAGLVVVCAVTAYLMARTDTAGWVAASCFPVAFTGLVWAGANVADVDPQLRALPVLAVLGALAIWRMQPELEVFAAVCGVIVSTVAIAAANDVYGSLAVHLTVAGAIVTATAIVHPERRELAWVGGLILAADTWVRLYDLGVHVPEAYTLPTALALIAVGGWRLRQDDESATLRFLAPGLALATVPSLVAMLDDPDSLRALILGAACLGLVLAGVAFRWSAPLVVGAVVGTVLVLRELAPYAAYVPTWLTIGFSGALLLAVGITWESRMRDVQRATSYVAALR